MTPEHPSTSATAAAVSVPTSSSPSLLPLDETAPLDDSASVDGDTASDSSELVELAAGYTHAWARRLFSCYDCVTPDYELEMAPPVLLAGSTDAELEAGASSIIHRWVQTGAAAAVIVPLCPCGASGWLRDLLLVARALAVVPSEEVPALQDTGHPAAVLHLQSGDEHAETDTAEDRRRWVARRLHRDGPRACCLLAVSLPARLRSAACACRRKGCSGCTLVSDVLRWVTRRQWHRIGSPRRGDTRG